MSVPRLPGFHGFERPQDSFYRLPYSAELDWFGFWRGVRENNLRRTVLGPLKVTEYVIKHTWGQLEFHRPVALSISNFEHGGRYRYVTDAGTGLQRRPIIEGIRFCRDIGLLDVQTDSLKTAHTDRRYRVRLSGPDPLAADKVGDAAASPIERLSDFAGFTHPDHNYFIVPKQWTNLTAELGSDVLILGVEYLFCHCWNWNRERKPEMTWLSVDEITQGRQYHERTSPDGRPKRYDGGIGFTIESVRQACHLGVVSGLLVRRQIHTPSGGLGDEQFTLRMQGMPQGDKYRFFSHSVEFGDLSGLFAPDSDPNRLSAPVARLAPPHDRLSAPASRQGALASRLDAPGDRPSAPAERLDAPLYRPSSVPAVSDLQKTPAEEPATTPTSIAAADPAGLVGQTAQDVVVVVVVDAPNQLQDWLRQIKGRAVDAPAAHAAILTLYRAQIEREAAIVAIGRWLSANRVFESTRRNIISAHPESITILRAIAEFESTENQGGADPVSWGRKVGGIFKQAARVVALANGFEIRAGQLLRDAQRPTPAPTPARIAAVNTLSPDQVIMIDMLGWQGFSANDARRLALGYHDAFERAALAQLAGWVDYMLTQSSLHSPLAYLRKCLEQLDKPPAARSEGPAIEFWSWREALLGEAPLPLKHPAVDYAAFQQRQAQIQLAQTQLSTAAEQADQQAASLQHERERLERESVAPERLGREQVPPVADPLEQRVSDFFGPEAQRVLDFVEMRQWRGVIAQAFARHPSLVPVFARVQVSAVDRESRTAQIQLRGASALEAGRFAVAELPRVMEHCAIGLSLDPAQAEPGLIELLAHWREVVREYRAQFGALSSVPADAHSHVPISMLWPLRVEDDVIEIGLLAPAGANTPAQAWLSERMSALAERPVLVRVNFP